MFWKKQFAEKEQYTLFSNRDILRLLVPLFVEQLLFLLVGTADTFMVASLGAASISAVSLSDMFNTMIASMFFALSTGGAVVVSQFIGAKKLIRARESAKQLLAVSAVSGAVIALLCEVFLAEIIHFFYGKLEPDVYAATCCYMRITLLGLPFIAVYGGSAALFRSMNQAKATMYISLGSNLVNIIGNAVLIFGCGLGVAGAAEATLLSRVAAMAVIVVLLADRRRMIYVHFRSGYSFSRKLVKKILAIGIPGGIENGVFQFGRLIVLGLIASYGTREIAANAVANTIDYFGCIAGNAFSLGVVTVIGQAVGAGDAGQVRFYVRKMLKWSYLAHFGWNVMLFFFVPLLLSCFHKLDAETRHLALILILIHNGFGVLMWVGSFIFPNILRSMNDVKWTMAISLLSMCIVRVGLSYALAPIVCSGVIAVWIAMIADWAVRIAGFWLRYRSGAWIKLCRLK